jgi:competence protein ComEC
MGRMLSGDGAGLSGARVLSRGGGRGARWRAFVLLCLGEELSRIGLFAPVVLVCGILIYFAMPVEPEPIWIGGCALVAAGCAGAAYFSDMLLRVLWGGLAILVFGFALAGGHSYSAAAPVLDWRYYGPVEGRVVALDRSASGALRVTLEDVVLGQLGPHRTPHRVRVALHGADKEARPTAGSRVMTTAHLSPPSGPAEPGGFDFQRYAWFQRLGAVGYTRVPLLLAEPLQRQWGFFAMRLWLSERVQGQLPGQTGAFASALMTGDRSGLSQETLQNLRQTNLAHLLAISGLHMGLLAGFVFGALRLGLSLVPVLAHGGAVKKLAALGALLAAAGYYGLSGGSIATERAFVMAAVALGAVLLDRRAISLRSVALAAVIIMLRAPDAILGPGFQMSFAATAALVLVFQAMSAARRGKAPRPWIWVMVSGTVISSFVAGLATLPIAAAHFNQIAHYGLIANLVSVPLMGALIIPLAVVAVLVMPLGLDGPVLRVMGIGLDWILGVAAEVATWPGALSKVQAPPSWALFALCIGFLLLGVMVTRLRLVGLVPIAIAVLAWSGADRPDVLISDTGSLVGILTTEGRAMSKAKGSGFVAGIWLENDGDKAVQEEAARRWPEGALRVAEIGGARLIAAPGKRGMAAVTTCAAGDMVVFSETFEGRLPCTVFDLDSLKRTGSVALNVTVQGGIDMTTAREIAGRRLWNDRDLRRAAMAPRAGRGQ